MSHELLLVLKWKLTSATTEQDKEGNKNDVDVSCVKTLDFNIKNFVFDGQVGAIMTLSFPFVYQIVFCFRSGKGIQSNEPSIERILAAMMAVAIFGQKSLVRALPLRK